MPYVILVFLLLTGCTNYSPDIISPDYIDSAFRPYTDCFTANSGVVMPEPFSIVFDDTGRLSGSPAQCWRNPPSKKKHVLVDIGFWLTADILVQEFVIFHEIGHCLLGLEHDDESLNFMNTTAPHRS